MMGSQNSLSIKKSNLGAESREGIKMIPIHELLNRIRWDKEFGKGRFALGYFDRIKNEIMVVPFEELWFDAGKHFYFQVLDTEGETHSIPFHRVKEVYKNGELIWHRKS